MVNKANFLFFLFFLFGCATPMKDWEYKKKMERITHRTYFGKYKYWPCAALATELARLQRMRDATATVSCTEYEEVYSNYARVIASVPVVKTLKVKVHSYEVWHPYLIAVQTATESCHNRKPFLEIIIQNQNNINIKNNPK